LQIRGKGGKLDERRSSIGEKGEGVRKVQRRIPTKGRFSGAMGRKGSFVNFFWGGRGGAHLGGGGPCKLKKRKNTFKKLLNWPALSAQKGKKFQQRRGRNQKTISPSEGVVRVLRSKERKKNRPARNKMKSRLKQKQQ